MASAFDTVPVLNRLRVLRAEQRVTQMRVAAAVGINLNRYWRIENGYTEPTQAEREALAAVFGVPVRKVFPKQAAA